MSELPRIAPAMPGDAIRPLKPTRGPERNPKRSRREKRRDKQREGEDPAAERPEDDDPDKGGGIDVRV